MKYIIIKGMSLNQYMNISLTIETSFFDVA
jgi:hypothetical protein